MRSTILSVLWLATVLSLLISAPVRAQQAATLLADDVAIAGKDTLIAKGAVEIFYRGARLKAAKITYQQADDQLLIDGPLVLTDDAGTLILADEAELSADMRDGILRSARLVLNQQLQMSSAEILRVGGRYTSLGRSIASSCKVCVSNPTPLWEIRASRIVHDGLERQIYFRNAQLRVMGVPVAWVPYLRMPDPTLKRSTGFLKPAIRTTDGLGFGLKMPYFIRLGDSRDLTVTPYLTTKSGRTLELRYRQAFTSGNIEVNGAVARDKLLPGELRGYLKATGEFRLPADYRLTFSGEVVSDDAYYLDYDLSSKDRLDSRIEISKTARNRYVSARLIGFHSIRAGDVNSTLPSIVSDVTWQRRFVPAYIGGEGGLRFQSHSQYRSSNSATDSDGDGISDGRDTARISLTADWRRNWILPGGVLLAALSEINGDFYSIRQDGVYAGDNSRVHGGVAVELRWPWTRNDASGVSHVIEPLAQLIWSPSRASTIPNEDSALVEFDAGNLFSLNRFPGADAVERGPRANLGLSYTRFDPAGWSLGVVVGRVIRSEDFGQFSAASGLSGKKSDWLAAIRLAVADGVTMTNRLVFGDSLDLTKGELRLDLQHQKFSLASSFVWMKADASENRATRVSELSLDGSYRFATYWQADVNTLYNFQTNRAVSAGVKLAFRNECAQLDMSMARRFTSSSVLQGSTTFGLSFDLLGFGGKGRVGNSGGCRG
tara:strand:+ start:2246 stop:4396 length:2151 start_codon:yes stop_codon:yes gene_type:complete